MKVSINLRRCAYKIGNEKDKYGICYAVMKLKLPLLYPAAVPSIIKKIQSKGVDHFHKFLHKHFILS